MNIYSPPSHITAPSLDVDNIQEYIDAEQKYIADLQAWAKRLAPTSKIAGELVSMPYADSAALYIIVQSSGKHGIMIVPVGDAWRDHNFESLVTVKWLNDYVKREKEFRKRFAKS
jgi:hypothetical protein